MAKADWKRWDFSWRLKIHSLSRERLCVGSRCIVQLNKWWASMFMTLVITTFSHIPTPSQTISDEVLCYGFKKSWKYNARVKKVASKLFEYFQSWSAYVIENFLDYCPTKFLHVDQFFSMYPNICINCIIFLVRPFKF